MFVQLMGQADEMANVSDDLLRWQVPYLMSKAIMLVRARRCCSCPGAAGGRSTALPGTLSCEDRVASTGSAQTAVEVWKLTRSRADLDAQNEEWDVAQNGTFCKSQHDT